MGRASFSLASGILCFLPVRAAAQMGVGTDRVATAQGLYESAVTRMKAGKPVEACPKLEESQRLDPAMGTQFFLAVCYEVTGRPTSAWSLFLQVANAARAAGNSVRESTARARAAALEGKLPRIAVSVSQANAGVQGLIVRRDGAALPPVVWGTMIPVDLGRHTVRVTATGREPWNKTVDVRNMGQRVDVIVPPLTAVDGRAPAMEEPPANEGGTISTPAEPGDVAAPTALPSRSLHGQKVAAWITGGVGVAGLVTGGVLGSMAQSSWNQANGACPLHASCSAYAHDESTRALSFATGSTIAFVTGSSAAAGAVILWFTAPSGKSVATFQVVPIAAGGLGAFASGAF